MVYRKRYILCALLCVLACVITLTGEAAGQERDTRRAKVYYNDAVKWYYRGDTAQTVIQLTTSLGFDSLYIPAHERLQDILTAAGKGDSLRAVYESWKDRYPEHPVYVYLNGRMREDEETAKQEFEHTLALNPNFYWAYVALGHFYIDRGDYESAAAEFQKAVKINPALADGQFGLGITYLRFNEKDRAIRQFKKTLLINQKTTPEAHFHLGLLYLDLPDTTSTLEHLNEYIIIAPNGPDCEFARVQVDSINIAIERARILQEEAEKAKKAEKKKQKKTENLLPKK